MHVYYTEGSRQFSSLRQWWWPANNHTSYGDFGTPLILVLASAHVPARSCYRWSLPSGFQRVEFVARDARTRFCRYLHMAPLLLDDEPEVRVRPEPCHHTQAVRANVWFTSLFSPMTDRENKRIALEFHNSAIRVLCTISFSFFSSFFAS